MAGSGRPDTQPDFLTGAFNTLKGFGQGVTDFFAGPPNPQDAAVEAPLGGQWNRGAVHAPIVGGALEGIGTAGGAISGLIGIPALAFDESGAARQAYDTHRRTLEGGDPGIFDAFAVARALNAARESRADQMRQLAEDENAVEGERQKAALGQFFYGGLPNLLPLGPAKSVIPRRAPAGSTVFNPSRAVGATSNLERMIESGGSATKKAARAVSDEADAAAGRIPLTDTSISPKRGLLGTFGAKAPQGAISSMMDDLLSQGLTEPQALVAIQHKFGAQAALRWSTHGDDFFVATPVIPGRSLGQAAAIAGRASERQPIGEAAQVFDQGQAFDQGYRPTEVGPKMGGGTPRENLGVTIEKIDAPDATVDYIRQVAEDNAGFEAQRRGVVTIAETQAAADKIAIDAQKYAYIKPGTALNAEQIKSTFDAMVTKGNEVTALQEALRAERAAGVSSKATELRVLSAAVEHQTLQRVLAGARAESGRALRIQREIADGLRSGDVNATWNRASELLGGKENASALLARLQDIWTDPKLTPVQRETAVYRFIRSMDEATTFEKITEYWTNAILSSPSTHIVNVTGQTLLQMADLGTNFLSAAVEAVSSGFGKGRTRDYTFSAAFGSVASLGRGFRQAVVNLKDAEKIAATKFRETGQLGRQAIGGPVGAVVNIPTKLLGAEDAVFRGLGEARGLYEGAYNVAAKEGLRPFSTAFAKRVSELIDDPTPEIVARMEEMGKRAGLRQDAGVVTQALVRLRKDVHVGPVQPLRFVIPFITTPVNLVKVGAEYSPFGFVRAIGKTGAGRSEAIARAGLGSAAMAYFAQEFAAGNVTAGPPQNPAEKDAFYAQGKIPYAVRIGGTWYSFSRLEPVATPLKWTAALMQTAQEAQAQGKSWDVTAAKMVFALARYLEDSTYLQGLSDMIDAMQDPNKAAAVIENLVTGFNPAIVRRIAQAGDPFIREPRNIIEQIEATLPYLNEQVPVRQTAFGEPAKRTEGKQGIGGVISPVDYSPEQNDPLLQKVASYQLPESIGPDGQMIPVRGLTVGLVSDDIATFSLNDSEAQRYQQYAGQATRNLLTKLFDDKLPYDGKPFSGLAYEDQIRAIRKTVTDARDVGRAQVAGEIIHDATNDGQVARGAIMQISVIGKLRDEARFLEGLQRQGLLTPQVRTLLDQRRNKDKPTVVEYINFAPLIDEYVNLPSYRIGDETEWARLRAARSAADKFAVDTDKPANVETWRWYAQVDPEGAQLIRIYSRAALRDPRRLRMLKEHPGLERYVSGA